MQNQRKYAKVSCCTVPKCWNMFNRLQKYLGIKFIQILRARTNSQVSDAPQMSAICDVVAQLIYLSNSCSVYVITPSRSVLLGAKDCVRHQKEKDNSINNNLGKVVFKYLECSRGFSFQLINQYAAKGQTPVFLSNKQQSPTWKLAH